MNKEEYKKMIDFLAVLGLAWIIFAVVQDLRSREIANWLNFSLIIFAMVYRLFYSIFSEDYGFVLAGVFGLIVFFVIANVFYYMRFFAGGDAKLMIALGALIPFSESFYINSLIFFIFIISLLFGGVLYSIGYASVLAFRNKREFGRDFIKEFVRNKKYLYYGFSAGFFLIVVSIILDEKAFMFPSALMFLMPFIFYFTKAIESSCMKVYVEPSKITVGDWIAQDINLRNGKKIKPYWEGLSEEEVNMIKKYYKKKILVKQGIPFSPSFLIAFLVLVYVEYLGGGNWQFPLGF